MKNYMQIATVALPLLFGGCESELKEPKREDYDKCNASLNTRSGILILVDDNADNRVDYVCRPGGHVVFATAELINRCGPYARTITAEFRNAASKVLQAERDLEFIADKEAYEAKKK